MSVSGAEGTLVEGKNLSRVVWGLSSTSPASFIEMKTSAQSNPRQRHNRSTSIMEQTPCGSENNKFRYGRARPQGNAALRSKKWLSEFEQPVNENVFRRTGLPSDWYDAT